MLHRDLLYAGRSLRKSPAFTLTAVPTIALGIGASTAIFSVVNAVLLRPLPYQDPQRLALIWGDLRARNVVDWPFSGPDFDDLRRSANLFDGIAAVNTGRATVAGDNAEAEMVRTGAVTPNFFSLMGARVALGRDFIDTDGTPQPGPERPGAGAAPPPAPRGCPSWPFSATNIGPITSAPTAVLWAAASTSATTKPRW